MILRAFSVDLDQIEACSLLQEVGRSRNGIFHAFVDAYLLEKKEFPSDIVKITERTMGQA